MLIVMILTTMWIVVMMVETVVDVTSLHRGAQNAYALIPMKAEVEQIAHKQQHATLDGLETIFVMTSTTM